MKVEFFEADANSTPVRAVRFTIETGPNLPVSSAAELALLKQLASLIDPPALPCPSDIVNADGSERIVDGILEIVET